MAKSHQNISNQKTNKLKKNIDLLCLIANESTAKCRKFLVSKGFPDASNHQQLEFNLARAYQSADDKKEFEQHLAEIHPHKDFILKYLAPAPTAQPLAEKAMAEIKEDIKTEKKSDACGCSGIDGYSNCSGNISPNASLSNRVDPLVFLGCLGIIAATLIIISKNK